METQRNLLQVVLNSKLGNFPSIDGIKNDFILRLFLFIYLLPFSQDGAGNDRFFFKNGNLGENTN